MTIAGAAGQIPQFTIGDRLRKARSLRGLDVKQFAELLEVDRNTVTNYELEKITRERMKPLVLRQWALATGVDLEWLKSGVGGPDDGESANIRPRD